jgi:hypothetical protein
VVHGTGLVGRRGYLWVDECSRVVDLGFRSGEQAGGVDSGVGVHTLSGPGGQFRGWSRRTGVMSSAVRLQVLRGRIIKGSPLGFTRAGSASLGRGSVSCP